MKANEQAKDASELVGELTRLVLDRGGEETLMDRGTMLGVASRAEDSLSQLLRQLPHRVRVEFRIVRSGDEI